MLDREVDAGSLVDVRIVDAAGYDLVGEVLLGVNTWANRVTHRAHGLHPGVRRRPARRAGPTSSGGSRAAVGAALIFTVLAATDAVDGYLARSRNEVTTFGKFIDPLADKLLVTAALVSLVELGKLGAWIAIIIISREFIVSGLRMVAVAEGKVIAASTWGKLKTVFQIIAIVGFIIKDSPVVRAVARRRGRHRRSSTPRGRSWASRSRSRSSRCSSTSTARATSSPARGPRGGA